MTHAKGAAPATPVPGRRLTARAGVREHVRKPAGTAVRFARHWPWTGVITDAHPTRQPGHQPGCQQPEQPKRPAERTDGPSRRIEAKFSNPLDSDMSY